MNNKKSLYSNLYTAANSKMLLCDYIPKNIIKEMKDATLASTEDKLERGFRICSSTKTIEDMNDKNTIM